MTTYIFNQSGDCIGQSINLRGMLERARRQGGVTLIEVFRISAEPAARRPGAWMRVTYRHGVQAETYWSCASHATEWAQERAIARPRSSWWHGCGVSLYDVPAGSWQWGALRCGVSSDVAQACRVTT